MTQLLAGRGAPIRSAAAVTPADGSDLPGGACRALWVGGSGNVALIAVDDNLSVTIESVSDGQFLPIETRRVLSTGTTATAIVALY